MGIRRRSILRRTFFSSTPGKVVCETVLLPLRLLVVVWLVSAAWGLSLKSFEESARCIPLPPRPWHYLQMANGS